MRIYRTPYFVVFITACDKMDPVGTRSTGTRTVDYNVEVEQGSAAVQGGSNQPNNVAEHQQQQQQQQQPGSGTTVSGGVPPAAAPQPGAAPLHASSQIAHNGHGQQQQRGGEAE